MGWWQGQQLKLKAKGALSHTCRTWEGEERREPQDSPAIGVRVPRNVQARSGVMVEPRRKGWGQSGHKEASLSGLGSHFLEVAQRWQISPRHSLSAVLPTTPPVSTGHSLGCFRLSPSQWGGSFPLCPLCT